MRALDLYKRKRNFRETKEPKGGAHPARLPIFVVQRHAARRLHFDFRLQVKGTLASWAVPKGPPEEAGEKRLAIHVEDHPIEYAKFAGDIPKGNYGAGHVDIWDEGTYEVEGPEPADAQIERGDFKFRLSGKRLNGRFVLVKIKRSEKGNEWLLIRKTIEPPGDGLPQAGEGKSPGVEREGGVAAPADLTGARKAPMPADVPVALAQLSDRVFSNDDWLFEIKWDGERSLALIQDGDVELRSRSGRNITAEYPELRPIVKQFNARKAILDGEIVVLDADGKSDFTRIQPRFGVLNPPRSLQQSNPVTYYLFDLLYCDGYDLRNAKLEQRKELLRTLLRPSENVRYSDHVIGTGIELYKVATERQLEGIVAKRRDSSYVGKRSSQWMKFKIVHDIDVVIGGWTAPRNSRGYFGALLMGLYEGEALKYIGSVGTGFDSAMLERTHNTLEKLSIPKSPFDTTPKLKETIYWAKPELVARVKYGQWTNDKKLRQPVFLGFQEDRDATDCRMEEVEKEMKTKNAAPKEKTGELRKPSKAEKAGKGKQSHNSAGPSLSNPIDIEAELSKGSSESLELNLDGKKVSLTHLNKLYFDAPALRKRDVLSYYTRVAPYILPFLKDRPLVLKRYPDGARGDFFFQKEAPASRPEWLRTVDIFSDERGGMMPYIVGDDLATLLYLTNLGCIDHNPWSSRFDDLDHPDYIFFDLDPTDGTEFDSVLKVARAIFQQLQALELRVFLKTSGASGFHMYIPIKRKYTYENARLFAGAIGQRVQAQIPKLVTFERTVSKRPRGTVLIDAVQNAKGKPLAAAYSLRPFPGAPVSTPVSPDELGKTIRSGNFNVKTVFERLKKSGDLWKNFWKSAQTLDTAIDKAAAR